jgi:hypothetical protein
VTRICWKCEISKPITEFAWQNRQQGKRQYRCKQCLREYVNSRDRDYTNNLARENYKRNAEKLHSYKESIPCTDCGNYYPFYVMDFDHLYDKIKNVSLLVKSHTFKKLLEEIKKCELVCANCHRIRTFQARLV